MEPSSRSPGTLAAYDILDSATETGYDDIVTLAAQICGTPLAYISFVDGNRQWFKAKVGFDMAENTVDRCFCQHTLRQAAMLVIPDLSQDARTAGNSLVIEAPNLRFYAGTVLKTPDDTIIGTVCVMDVNPHPDGLLPAQKNALLALARQVMELLQLRLSLRERALMALELNHRIKNTLTIVRSIASQTFRAKGNGAELKVFNDRLEALGAAHNILIERNWTSGSFQSVVRTTLAPHAREDQVIFDGPDLDINPVAAVSLSLLLHELATNALKYGALSVPSGRVRVSWTVSGDDADAMITLSWSETGGPPVSPPLHQGFGSKLIRSGIAGSRQSELSYKPDGFAAEFRTSLASVKAQ